MLETKPNNAVTIIECDMKVRSVCVCVCVCPEIQLKFNCKLCYTDIQAARLVALLYLRNLCDNNCCAQRNVLIYYTVVGCLEIQLHNCSVLH